MKNHALKLLSFMLRLSLAVLLGGSLLSGLLPSVVVASALGIESVRACCIGKGAGHCKVALKVKRPAQEPMCGAKPTQTGILSTVIAEESNDSNVPHASSPSFGNCADHCSSCAGRANQQLKQFKRVVVVRAASSRSSNIVHIPLHQNLTASSAELDLFSPRGPPFSLN